MSNITIYHNPACGTSRNTLEMIRNSGTEPTIIYYLETPPTRDVNRPGFPGECFICELRLPDQYFRWKHNKLFLLL
ncbi:hypothetical protein ACRWE7_12025, partial [Escherichia coli]